MLFTDDIKRNAFLLYCYFQYILGVLVVGLIFIHPESEVFLIPSIIINLFIPAILIYISRYRFDEAVIVALGINFISTTAYVITSKIVDQNALTSMLFLTYLIHSAVINIVFGKKRSIAYFIVGFIIILMKQLRLFAAYEFEFVYNYSPIEYLVFLTLYAVTLLLYMQMCIHRLKGGN